MPANPAPLFDQVTGFPPDDALDVTLSVPVSLAVYMTMLESTGHAADVAALRRIHVDEARETARSLRTAVGAVAGASEAARVRITHIVDERIPGVNGLRPHVHYFVGATVRDDGREVPVDVDALTLAVENDLAVTHRDRLVATSARRCGLVWGPTSWSPDEVLEPAWLASRAAEARRAEPTCAGPWPRRQIVPGDAPRPEP